MNDMAHAVLRLLEENKIDHTLAEHPAVFNMEELYAQGLEHCDAIAKNLLVRDQKKRFYWLLVLYGEKRADLKALKARLGHGALSFAGAPALLVPFLQKKPAFSSFKGWAVHSLDVMDGFQ